jgi:hypothetical protein
MKSYLHGFAYFGKAGTAVECVVHDISDSGARLKFLAAPPIVDTIELHIQRTVSSAFSLSDFSAGAFYPLARGCRRIRRGELMLDLLGPPSALRRRLGARW